MLATCCSLHTLGPKRKFVELGSMFSEPSPFPSLILPEAQFCQHLMRSNISVPPPLAQNNGSGALTQQRPILQITGGGSAGQPGTLGPSEGLIPLPPDQYLLLVHSLQSHTQKCWALITKENLITNHPSHTQTQVISHSSRFRMNNLRPKVFLCNIFIPNGSLM